MNEDDEKMIAGSIQDVAYEFFHFVDALMHMLNLDGIPFFDKYAARFCAWTHRKG